MGKKIADLMTTRPRAVQPQTPVTEAAQLMDMEDVGSLPVVDLAQREGIPVVAYEGLIAGAPLDGYITFDNLEVGRLQAQYIVDHVDPARRVHPADIRVEALIDEELAPGRSAVGVQPFLARHLKLGAEEEAGVRIDQEEGVAVLRVGRSDREAV